MAKRGRPSSASLVSFPGVTDTPPRFTPPSFLTNAEQSLFSEIVNGTDARHFVEADTPLIVSFVKATVLARDAPDLSDEEFAAWEKLLACRPCWRPSFVFRRKPGSTRKPRNGMSSPPVRTLGKFPRQRC
jgi:hypothetical protein